MDIAYNWNENDDIKKHYKEFKMERSGLSRIILKLGF